MVRTLDVHDHRRELLANRYVYAVVSRRARGLSIGINLNPDKVCNFDCPYCQVDRTTPGGPAAIEVPVLLGELERLLDLLAAGDLWSVAPFDTVDPARRHVADIAFAGDGEPTTPREFPAAARAVRAERDRRGLQFPVRLISNASVFHRASVREALADFDELWCKLDAGTEAYFQKVDGTRLPFARILDNLLLVARERSIVVQSLFLTFDGKGPDEAEITAYCARLRDLVAAGGRIDRVQVYTVSRKPADPRVGALPLERLDEIASRVSTLGIPAEVFGAD
jgi:wyosine [tRNA(Phe)-imidazoG37] synthetase (radical SAM superfamily)